MPSAEQSAKRCRDREKQEERALQETMKKNNEKIAQLEARVQNLTDTLEKRQKKSDQAAARRAKSKSKASTSKAASYQSGTGVMRGDPF